MMILNTTWERYFLKEIFKSFILFLICFYALYSLVDYSNHAASFKNYHFTFFDIIKFYSVEFFSQADILIPFSLLIASIKTLSSLNAHNELVALMTSGVSKKRLLLPFILFAFICSFFVYMNTEIFQPLGSLYNTQLDQARAKAKQKKYNLVQQITLEDNSLLIYEKYDEETKKFYDVFWVRSIDDIYRMKTLSPHTPTPIGNNVEHLQRNNEGHLILKEKKTEMALNDLHLKQEKLLDTLKQPETLSLSTLYHKIQGKGQSLNQKEALILTTFYYKLVLPFLPLIVIMATTPFCIQFNRSQPIFLIYLFSIFGLVLFYLIMDAALVLGEKQTLSAAVAIFTPFLIFFNLSLFNFLYKLR